ncbi:MAG: hypothetical protein K9L21_03415 [Spirochaetia bacterium]|nr:hypothetical protein [Spirochaetia bacterium]
MRTINLLKKDLLESRKAMMIYGLTLFIIMLLSSTLTILTEGPYYHNTSSNSYLEFFISFLFLGGFIIGSLAFRDDMYGKSTQHNWLMLPASPIEKLAVKMITVLIIYPVALLLFITASSLIVEGFNLLVFKTSFQVLNPLNPSIWKSILNFIVVGSIFLMGSAYFRKAAFVKTVLILGLIGFGLGMITILAGRVVFSEFFTGMNFNNELFISNFAVRFDSPDQYVEFRVFEIIGKVIYWALLAPFCWVVSYFRVREVQAYDAV